MQRFAVNFPRTLEARLLVLVGFFLGLYGLALTGAPLVRLQSWNSALPWQHWIGLAGWIAVFVFVYQLVEKSLPVHDPFFLPLAGLLSGWGLMNIFRVAPGFGLRQSAWLFVAAATMVAILRLDDDLRLLRRYKYLWLSSGLVLTGLTFILGTNPAGFGPRLWLGCCGIYLQPSEPLKLLLIVYLAAYLADRQFLIHKKSSEADQKNQPFGHLLALLSPTLLMVGVAAGMVMVQRDLGTASTLVFLYAGMVYLASGDRRVVVIGLAGLLTAAVTGYYLYDVFQTRLESWINPWLDPTGGSYQIIQSLIGIANGGLIGRGPGLGSPGLIPVVHSDFIFVAIAEENGLAGAIALLAAVGIIAGRGFFHALRAGGIFRRMLGAGLSIYIAGQTILIVGGNLRLLPLTGVTFPFVSYGGSSLIVSFIAIALLLKLSANKPSDTISDANLGAFRQIGFTLGGGLIAAILFTAWWALFRAPDLLGRTDNARRVIADRFVERGALVDRDNVVISESTGSPGSYERHALYPQLGPVIGYTHLVYGQAGIEASADDYLRGISGYPPLESTWHQFLYGQPPPGLDVRLSLDLHLQSIIDQALEGKKGSAVLLNAENGEILALSSQPGFDPNRLDEDWEAYFNSSDAPLLNRALQGLYPPAAALGPILLAEVLASGKPVELPSNLGYWDGEQMFGCAIVEERPVTFGDAIMKGCPGATARLGNLLENEGLLETFNNLGLFTVPDIGLPATENSPILTISDPGAAAMGFPSTEEDGATQLRISPLNMALAAAPLSSGGYQPTPRLILAHSTPDGAWRLVSNSNEGKQILPAATAAAAAEMLADPNLAAWHATSSMPTLDGETAGGVTWFIGGSREQWQGSPIVLVIVIEEDDPRFVTQIGLRILSKLLVP